MTNRATTLAVLVILSAVTGVASVAVAGADAGGNAAGGDAIDCEYPLEVTDATGTTVTITEEPQDVVTLAPSAAQTMWEVGGREKVVGVSQFATYLAGASEKANVSAPGFGQYNLERMVTLQPDVVLAPNVVPNGSVSQMRSAGLTVVKFEAATSIGDVAEKTELFGRITGLCEGAADANEWMRANLRAVETAIADRERPPVLYLLGGGYSVGSGTYVDGIISRAGGRNVVAAAGIGGYPEISAELVVERDPRFLLTTFPDPPAADRAPYNSTTAVEEGNVVVVDPNYVNQPAPRSVVYAVRNLTERFHPAAFEDVEYVPRSAVAVTPTPTATATETETATPTADGEDGDRTATATETEVTMETGTPTETETETRTSGGDDSEGGGQPGFGAVAATVAVLVTLLVVARRRD